MKKLYTVCAILQATAMYIGYDILKEHYSPSEVNDPVIIEVTPIDNDVVTRIEVVTDARPPKRNPAMYVNCLAANIYHEARGEDIAGKKNVAFVTINRVFSKSHNWPDDVCSVVYQKAQFSWTISGKSRITDLKSWEESLQLSKDILTGKVEDVSKGATHYYAHDKVTPWWKSAYAKVEVVGNHTFLK